MTARSAHRTALAAVLLAGPAMTSLPAAAADRATYLASCEKDAGADKAKCACMADKIDSAFKNKARAFAYLSMSSKIGDLVNVESGLTEKEEDDVTDKTFAFMKDCGLAK